MLFKKQFLAYWKDGGGDREKWGGWYVYAKRNKLGWSQPKLQLLLLTKISLLFLTLMLSWKRFVAVRLGYQGKWGSLSCESLRKLRIATSSGRSTPTKNRRSSYSLNRLQPWLHSRKVFTEILWSFPIKLVPHVCVDIVQLCWRGEAPLCKWKGLWWNQTDWSLIYNLRLMVRNTLEVQAPPNKQTNSQTVSISLIKGWPQLLLLQSQ